MAVSNRREIIHVMRSRGSTRMIFRHSQVGVVGSTLIYANVSVFTAARKPMRSVQTAASKSLLSAPASMKKG